jgi:hypothetical protein
MDKYEVLKQLGKGGMGTAYMVRRKAEPGSAFAIKQVCGRQAERACGSPASAATASHKRWCPGGVCRRQFGQPGAARS